MPLISIRGLEVRYRTQRETVLAVRDFDLDVFPGETVALVGESGSGKSTVALAIAGLLDRRAAQVAGIARYGEIDLLAASERQLRRLRGREIAMIFQDPMTSLNPYLNIGLQVAETPIAHGTQPRAARAAAVQLLERMQVPDAAQAFKRFPHQFSGGMRQRAMIASAFSGTPRLLLADEPTTSLDVITQDGVLRLLKAELVARQMALLLITHDLGIVAGIADRVVVMKDGGIVETGPVLDLYRAPRHPYTRRLLAAVPRIDGSPAGLPGESLSGKVAASATQSWGGFSSCPKVRRFGRKLDGLAEPSFHRQGIGPSQSFTGSLKSRPTASQNPFRTASGEVPGAGSFADSAHSTAVAGEGANGGGASASGRPPPLRIDQAAIHFPRRAGLAGGDATVVKAVDGVSLELRRGEVLGLVGQSGSGKSTLIRAVAGLVPLTGGRIEVDGQPVESGNRGGLRQLRRRLQMVFQDPRASLNPRLTVERIVAEPLVNFSLAGGRAARRRAHELMERVRLPGAWGSRYPHELSGGQCQRINIARALAVEPELLLCDEPVSALDVSIQAEIVDLLQELRRDLGLTILFISHDLAVVRHLADRVAVMHQGRLVELQSASDIYAKAEHPYTRTLLAAIPIPDPTAYRVGG